MLSASLSQIKISLRWILLIPVVLQTLGAVGLVSYLSYRSREQAVENLANQLVGEVSHCIQDRLDTYLDRQQQAVEQGSLSVFLNKLHFSNLGKVLIIERSGELVAASTDITQVNAQLSRLPAVQSGDIQTRSLAQTLLKKYGSFRHIKTTTLLHLNINQERQFIQITPYSDRNGVDWLVIISVPATKLISAIEANKTQTFILCFLILVFTGVSSIFTVNWISKPILNLSYASQALAGSEAALRAAQEVAHIGSWEEVSDRKQLELALQASQAKLNDILNSASASITSMRVYKDGSWDINHVSAGCEVISGYTAEELRNDKYLWVSRIVPEDSESMTSVLFDNIFAERTATYEYRLYHKDGTVRWISETLNSRWDVAENCWFVTGISSDITDRKRSEAERQQIDQMKNEFISVVSHELRTPLTAIHGALGMLASGVFDKRPQRGQEMLTIAWNNCDRLVRLVNDILDLERLESGKTELVMKSCPVDVLMQQAVDAVQAIALQTGIILEVTPLSMTITAAPDAIVQTLINLLSNAIKFSPSDSRIWLTAEIQKEIGEQQKAYVLFTVKDQGRGIPDDKLEKIFGRFQQVDVSDARQKGGTGLGLAICKSIVEQHNGQIWVESVFGEGSSFYFTLPVKI
jgi:PAS domain S-box-containing protein